MADITYRSELLGAFTGVILFIGLAVYIYTALVLMTIAKKTETEYPWLAWIPFANLYLMTQIANVPWWTFLIVIAASFIPFAGQLIVMGMLIWWWWRIAEERAKPGWLSLLMLIPIVNFIIMGVLAWSDN